ncbi:MAG TPA: formate dehydrogenase accessory sulfurtransferase FdhD [Actinomycetota bacterium]|jgi:FdhD protein|nr:formate dehydrogenase accessory sulfurtransferase FdhD [Actinomycetota bacterium]
MAQAVPLRRTITRTRVVAVRGDRADERPDRLAAEEPMEIRVQGPGQDAVSVAVTMRTPGGDFELAAGFLFTEGLIAGPEELRTVSYCRDLAPEDQHYNVVTVSLAAAFDRDRLSRNFFATSSCGICGKAALEHVEVRCAPVGPGPTVRGSVIGGLPAELRRAQSVFDQTGGLHAAGLFGIDGVLLSLREDVGRHNAVDKVIGEALLARSLPLSERILLVSGRASFEIVQKAAVAQIPIVAAVSAPSSLAVDTADRFGMTLLGFLRDDRFNVYTRPGRIVV